MCTWKKGRRKVQWSVVEMSLNKVINNTTRENWHKSWMYLKQLLAEKSTLVGSSHHMFRGKPTSKIVNEECSWKDKVSSIVCSSYTKYISVPYSLSWTYQYLITELCCDRRKRAKFLDLSWQHHCTLGLHISRLSVYLVHQNFPINWYKKWETQMKCYFRASLTID